MNTILQQHHLKTTKKREVLLEVFHQATTPLVMEQVYEAAKQRYPMNMSTVYRSVGLFCENKIVSKTMSHDGKVYYQLNRHEHKHTLLCSSCNRHVTIDSCPLHELEESLEKASGFVIQSHNLEFVGLCPACQKQAVK